MCRGSKQQSYIGLMRMRLSRKIALTILASMPVVLAQLDMVCSVQDADISVLVGKTEAIDVAVETL